MIRSILVFLASLILAQAKKPNILVIIVDDLGYGDLSSYGATDLKSPHIDKLISQGLRFNNCYANCPVCSPTRAALLTGRYQELVGVPGVIRTKPEDNWGYLAPSATTLPQALKPLGYHTAAIGKWHLGLDDEAHPNTRGFDHFHGFLGDMMDEEPGSGARFEDGRRRRFLLVLLRRAREAKGIYALEGDALRRRARAASSAARSASSSSSRNFSTYVFTERSTSSSLRRALSERRRSPKRRCSVSPRPSAKALSTVAVEPGRSVRGETRLPARQQRSAAKAATKPRQSAAA